MAGLVQLDIMNPHNILFFGTIRYHELVMVTETINGVTIFYLGKFSPCPVIIIFSHIFGPA